MDFLAPFQYDFMQRAFVVALFVGALCSMMGTYVVLRKLSFIGDGLAHASFAGIAIAYLRGANFYAGAAVATIVVLGCLRQIAHARRAKWSCRFAARGMTMFSSKATAFSSTTTARRNAE